MSDRADPSSRQFWADSPERAPLRHYQALVNATDDGIYQVDDQGRFLAVNRALAELSGYAREALFDTHVGTIFEDGSVPERELDRLHSSDADSPRTLEATIQTNGGEHIRCEIRANPLETNGCARGYVGIVRTLAEGNRSETRRSVSDRGDRDERESATIVRGDNEWLRLALEAGEMGAWELDLRTTDSPLRSPQHDRIFGYEEPLDDWSLEAFLEHVHPDDRDEVKRRFEEAFETGNWEFECRIRRSDDVQRWIAAQGEFYYDAGGEPIRAVGIVEDITDQKERERDLRDTKSKLEAATEAGAIGTWEWHVPEDRVAASVQFAKTFGVDPGAAREGVSIERFVSAIHEDDRTRVQRDIEEALDSCGDYESEYRVRGADGELRWVFARGHVNCNDDGTPTTFPGALTDITERKEYERKLEASNERLEQFAYTASHDLQEPLRMVSSYLSLIETRYADELDEDGREFIEYAVDGADRMREMIDGLLEYSQIETHGDPFETIALDGVLDDVLADLRLQIEETNAEITVDSLPRVEADASQVRQVFQNVLSNALTYSGDDAPRVHVGSREWGERRLVSIEDEGIGIDPENHQSVFDVFERLQTREEHGGTGIGLALCDRIIERHGGDIWVDSGPDEGTTFLFTLPAADG